MAEESIARILKQLRSRESHLAWSEFLQEYSPLILQVVRRLERDPDHVSDCFLFACEQLSRDRFRRLTRFRLDGPARFTTWLQAVVHNLCLDWHRQEFGRHRVFQSVARLSPLDQEVFRCLYESEATLEESMLLLVPRFPGINRQAVSESITRIESSLSPRQRWLLAARRRTSARSEVESDDDSPSEEILDARPNPESAAALEELRAWLRRALASLAPEERLILQFRFEEELTLEQVAKLMGLGDAQGADRRIQTILKRLREQLE